MHSLGGDSAIFSWSSATDTNGSSASGWRGADRPRPASAALWRSASWRQEVNIKTGLTAATTRRGSYAFPPGMSRVARRNANVAGAKKNAQSVSAQLSFMRESGMEGEVTGRPGLGQMLAHPEVLDARYMHGAASVW